jgi:hypothetical protein
MRVLLDECLDWRFARSLQPHEVRSVRQENWTGLKNGELLSRAQASFDVFLTIDSNIEYQQDVTAFDIAIVVLHARSNRFEDLNSLALKVLELVPYARKGVITRIGD